MNICLSVLVLMVFTCSACGTRPWHKKKSSELAPAPRSETCSLEASENDLWRDDQKLAARVQDMLNNNCMHEAELLEAKGSLHKQQITMGSQVSDEVNTSDCISDKNPSKAYFSTHAAADESNFGACLNSATTQDASKKCLDNYQTNLGQDLATAKLLAQCS